MDAAAAWLARGPALVVMTRGEAGAIGLTAGSVIEAPGRSVTVRDTVGAGDTFTAGLLGSLDRRGLLDRAVLGALEPEALGACLDVANRAASITCTRSGAEPPTLDEVLSAAALPRSLG